MNGSIRGGGGGTGSIRNGGNNGYWTEQFPPEKTAALLFLISSFLKCFPLSSTIYALETLLMQLLRSHHVLLNPKSGGEDLKSVFGQMVKGSDAHSH